MMKNLTSMTLLYGGVLLLASLLPREPIFQVLVGLAALATIGLTLRLIEQKTGSGTTNRLIDEVRQLREKLDTDAADNSPRVAAQLEATAQRLTEVQKTLAGIEPQLAAMDPALQEGLAPLEDRIAAVEAQAETILAQQAAEPADEAGDSTEADASAYAGWPRAAKVKKARKPALTAVAVDDRFVEIIDILYPLDGSAQIYCAECYRGKKKKLNAISLRPDGSAFFCDVCDTWIPTDPQDKAARTRALKKALQTTKSS